MMATQVQDSGPIEATAAITRRARRISPLTFKIMGINVLALIALLIGLFFLDDYRNAQIEARIDSMRNAAALMAGEVGATASTVTDTATGQQERLAPELARSVLRRLAEQTRLRARLFAATNEQMVDTRVLGLASEAVEVAALPAPEAEPALIPRLAYRLYDWAADLLPREAEPQCIETALPSLIDYPEARAALQGETVVTRCADPVDGSLVIAVAVPVQRYREVLGALIVSTDSTEIEIAVREARLNILKVFGIVLTITLLVSAYLAGTIARPIVRLAQAADRVSRGQGLGAARDDHHAPPQIPDMSRRHDEIGDLSGALNDMTQALWRRLDAIERFAADVAHEIRNPLTSLKSAVETASRVSDPAQRERLMGIVVADVKRIDRLIADISSASRLDAELSRAQRQPVDLLELVKTLVDINESTRGPDDPRLMLRVEGGGPLVVPGLEDRLGQVFRNVIRNAETFSPRRGAITITAARGPDAVTVTIDDEGPGVPEDKRERIFDRFYRERPKDEEFGQHSGLGLSISRQIVDAHGGRITAENRRDETGAATGARFTIRLPTH
jgi:two-component system sensor histidine kinase ChvG